MAPWIRRENRRGGSAAAALGLAMALPVPTSVHAQGRDDGTSVPGQPTGRAGQERPSLPRTSNAPSPGVGPAQQPGVGELPGPIVPDTLQAVTGLESSNYANVDPRRVDDVERLLLPEARRIPDPAERAVALQRVAQALAAGDRLAAAQEALEEAGRAALQMRDSLARDVRLDQLVNTAISLADNLVNSAMTDTSLAGLDAAPRPVEDRAAELRRIADVHTLGGALAERLMVVDLHDAALARLARAEAHNSQEVLRNLQSQERGAQVRVRDAEAVLRDAQQRGDVTPAEEDDFRAAQRDLDQTRSVNRRLVPEADRLLAEADGWAVRIVRPLWRDRTRVDLVGIAATSNQYARGLTIARSIPAADARADALIRIAEGQAWDGLGDEATQSYQEAVDAVYAIPLIPNREVFGTVLLDSLMAVGRFDDARIIAESVTDPMLRIQALSLVARGMGERGLAEKAFAWVDTVSDPALRARLRRAATDGAALFVEKARTARKARQDASLGPGR